MPSTAELVALLDRLLGPGSEEVVAAPDVAPLGLALDHADLGDDPGRFGAVLLHRSYGFAPPPGLGVVACHDPFDRALGLALDERLHAQLGLTEGEQLDAKVTLHRAPVDLIERATAVFGGREALRVPLRRIEKVAMADAMTERTVKQAAGLGAGLYVTGTWRVPGAAVVDRSGIGVLVVGHARQERHALRTLASLLEQQGFGITLCMR